MLFNSVEYFIFLPIVLYIYYRLRHGQQNIFLLAASYIFYSFWDVRFLTLILISTIVDYHAGHWIKQAQRENDRRKGQAGVLLSVITNLSILGFFKYFNFFAESTERLLATTGLSVSPPLLQIVLPVGISFYTFQTLSYTIDVYRGKLEPTDHFINFALFVAFFPQLVAGPIERAVNLLPQISHPRTVTQTHWNKGLYLILIGLVRKVVIADTAGVIADQYFASPQSHTSLQLMVGLLLYSLQIYGDFAGYSSIARGTAMLLGFDLMRNFRHPYFAANVADFWRRWHISLSTWLRDYLYIPLGGNRKGKARTYINLLVTMLLGGLWHGANWNFLFWGFLHGLYLALHRVFRILSLPKRKLTASFANTSLRFVSMGATFILVTFTWLFFRTTNLSTIQAYLAGLAKFSFDGQADLVPWIFLAMLTLFIDLPQAILRDEYCFLRLPRLPRAATVSAAILLLIFSGGTEVAPFIYFQF